MTDGFIELCSFLVQRHALVVAFHYPPEASSSGVLRTLKFTRYLRDFEWRCTVLTVERSAYEATDPTLEAQIPTDVRVVRTRYLNTQRHLSIRGKYLSILAIPDRWIGWRWWAVPAGRRIANEDRYDLVYSTSPFATAHLIGRSLASAAKVPHVVDFRDPWYEDPPEPDTPRLAHFFAKHMERSVMRTCAYAITSTDALCRTLQSRYPLAAHKIAGIANGYDEADFAETAAGGRRGDRFTMLHIGSINPNFRDPRPLFGALRSLATQGVVDLSRIDIRFYGGGEYAHSSDIAQSVRDNGLERVVRFIDRVPYHEALAALQEADLLLLLQASEDTVGLVPAKLYEYLRANRPVLACVLPGAAQEVIDRTQGGWVVDPRDEHRLTESLRSCYDLWREGVLARRAAAPESIRRFDRRELTSLLARTLHEVATTANGSVRR